MTDRPILFSAPMVRALLDGRKTQTRRIAKFVKPEPNSRWHVSNRGGGMLAANEESVVTYGPDYAPYEVGDRLWCRETWCSGYDYDDNEKPVGDEPRVFYAASECPCWYDTDTDTWRDQPKWRPSIFMPRQASRLTLTVTNVRVQRLQDISEEDARAEGVKVPLLPEDPFTCYRRAYHVLWHTINGAGSWEANPWVVALTFTVHPINIDEMPAQQEIAA